jgi:hypothetical protein
MNIRKIAVVGSFAAGAALAFAPLAAADPLTSTVDTEIASLNSLFTTDAALAGDSAHVVTNGANTFDTIPLSFAPDSGTPNLLDYELYGLNPIANASSDPGAYDVFNGALTEFDDAYNTDLYALLNGGALIPATDLIGSSETITDAFANGTGSVSDVATYFFEFGANDLSGYFDLPSLFPALIP